jgi:hypothetical protein
VGEHEGLRDQGLQRRERIADTALLEAMRMAERGLVDADLGGGLIKQRIARPGQGKSGGFRTLIAYRRGERAVFQFGFVVPQRRGKSSSRANPYRTAA